jgi:colanic acid biosynthesis glycosyl transferase WcaI
MGNIGHSQGLTELVRAFEESDLPSDVRLVITGSGVAAPEARAELRTPRVEMLGVVDDDRLEAELERATIAFVSQRYEGAEFNIPSKLMNLMAYGLPVLVTANPGSEVARIVRDSGAGWVVDSSRPESFPLEVERLRGAGDEIGRCAAAAAEFAASHFTQPRFAERFDELLREVARGPGSGA